VCNVWDVVQRQKAGPPPSASNRFAHGGGWVSPPGEVSSGQEVFRKRAMGSVLSLIWVPFILYTTPMPCPATPRLCKTRYEKPVLNRQDFHRPARCWTGAICGCSPVTEVLSIDSHGRASRPIKFSDLSAESPERLTKAGYRRVNMLCSNLATGVVPAAKGALRRSFQRRHQLAGTDAPFKSAIKIPQGFVFWTGGMFVPLACGVFGASKVLV